MFADLFSLWFYDDVTARRLRMSYAMDRGAATASCSNVQPDEPTRVVRAVYQPDEAGAAVDQPSNLHDIDVRK